MVLEVTWQAHHQRVRPPCSHVCTSAKQHTRTIRRASSRQPLLGAWTRRPDKTRSVKRYARRRAQAVFS
jgi:hypothetical protein